MRTDSNEEEASCVERPNHSHAHEPSTTFLAPTPAQSPETFNIASVVDVFSHVELAEESNSNGQISEPPHRVDPLSVPSGLENNRVAPPPVSPELEETAVHTVPTVSPESERAHANDLPNDDKITLANDPIRSTLLLPCNDNIDFAKIDSPCEERMPLSEDVHPRGRARTSSAVEESSPVIGDPDLLRRSKSVGFVLIKSRRHLSALRVVPLVVSLGLNTKVVQ